MKNLREAFSLVRSHLRIGYVSGLLVFDLLGMVCLIVDLTRMNVSGISWRAAIRLTATHFSPLTWKAAIETLVFLLFILPMLLASVRIAVAGKKRAPSFFGWRAATVKYGHISLALILSCSFPFVYSAELLGGPAFSGEKATYAFAPLYEFLYVGPISWLVLLVPTVWALLVAWFGRALIVKTEVAPHVRDYIARMKIADLKSDVHPLDSRHTANFNTAAGAPEIRMVCRLTESYIDNYRSRVSGTNEAGNYLLELSIQCKQLIANMLFNGIPQSHGIEFYPGTSRAFEVALMRSQPKVIILSPYEHPVEVEVTKWYCTYGNARVVRILFSEDDFVAETQAQVDKVAHAINDAVSDSDGRCALVISEVCSLTGHVVPVKRIVAAVQLLASSGRLSVIVDAAHAVGNIPVPLNPGQFDAYVFSGHKWLFAAEPIGVLISRGGTASYDVWGNQIPNTWSSARAIAALHASLDMLRQYGLRFFLERSADLKNRFQDNLDDTRFMVVGRRADVQESNMISVTPTLNYGWRHQALYLRDFLRSQKVYPLVIDHGASGTLLSLNGRLPPPWLRISFPYFLDVYEIEVLAEALRNAVERASLA